MQSRMRSDIFFKYLNLKIHIDDGLLSSATMEQHEIDVAKFLHAAFKIDLALDIALRYPP